MKKADLLNVLLNNPVDSILIDGDDGLREYFLDDLDLKDFSKGRILLLHNWKRRD